jgi:hypothetical protein
MPEENAVTNRNKPVGHQRKKKHTQEEVYDNKNKSNAGIIVRGYW